MSKYLHAMRITNVQLLLLLTLSLLLPATVCSWALVAPLHSKKRTSLITKALSSSSSKNNELWNVEKVDHISEWTSNQNNSYPNPLSLKDKVPSSWFVGLNDAVAMNVKIDALETLDDTCVLPDDNDENSTATTEQEECTTIVGRDSINAEAFILAGPRSQISFDPSTSKAAIVTCGGLCPGLNSVVREVVMCLSRQYGVQDIVGIPKGYRGFLYPEEWKRLDEGVVQNLHMQGGSMLGSSRGGHDTDAIVDSLVKENINLLFISGGDGTVRGAAKIAQEVKRRGLAISVACIPKTIDNDIPLIDRTFGFETACEAACEAINVANTEAEGFPFGLGVVKVMGRNSGFIAMHSALGSCVADLCLVPEVDFYLDGKGGIVDHLYERLLVHDKAVVVVAEGAGQKLMAEMGAAGEEEVKDASGNVLLDDIGPWLCKQLKRRLDERLEEASPHGDKLTLKYVDPSYMVRGIPPNTADNLYCLQLAHNAVHGAMAGLTNFIVGSVNTKECYVPISMVANKRNVIDTSHQSLWEMVVFSTGQPSFQTNDDGTDEDDAITTASGGTAI